MTRREVVFIVVDEATYLPPSVLERMADARIKMAKLSASLEASVMRDIKAEQPVRNDREHWKQNAQRHNFKRRK